MKSTARGLLKTPKDAVLVMLAFDGMTVFSAPGVNTAAPGRSILEAAGFAGAQKALDADLDLFAGVRAEALTQEEAQAVEGEGPLGYAIGYGLGIGIGSAGGGVIGGFLYTATAYALYPYANLNEAFGLGYTLGSIIGAGFGAAFLVLTMGTIVGGFIPW